MQRKHLRFGKGFRVAFNVRRAQVAEMVLAPGDSEGSADNRHRGADQWLYVVSGSGVAIVEGARVPLKAGSLLVIAGFHARLGAAVIAINMVFAVALAHLGQLQQLNDTGGWAIELQAMFLAGAITVALIGPGRFSVNQR